MNNHAWRNGTVVFASVVLAYWFWASPFLYPFRLLVTLFHEFGHALATYLVGGHVARIEIDAMGAGVTHSYGWYFGDLGRFVITSGGYLGSACFGALILVISGKPKIERYLLPVLTAWLGIVGVFFWGGLFTFVACIGLAGLFFLASRYLPVGLRRFVATFLGIFTALYALRDTVVLITSQGAYHFVGGAGRSDAEALQDLTHIPAVVWAVLWLGISLAVVWLALRHHVTALPGQDDVATTGSPASQRRL
ncbi:MAG: M50 family metallopeptidase [Candidatus Sericytochromatia bacterium]|nr:M50 family metallopeptidase [Candidatus Sericytochromatia bacterium]